MRFSSSVLAGLLSLLAQTVCINAQIVQSARTIKATIPSGDTVEIYRHGATVTSWTSGNKEQLLFLSTAAVLNGSAAIRGGIPVVFPNFGTPAANHSTSKMPQHGFARNSTWEFVGSKKGKGISSLDLIFHLNSSLLIKKYQQDWPYSVDLTYTVTLSPNTLSADFRVANTDKVPIDFQFLLHSYLALPDITKATVSGLEGSKYQDKTQDYKVIAEKSNAVTITNETDRIYTPATVDRPIVLSNAGKPRISVIRENLPDVTVWNLWETKAKTTVDFAPKTAWKNYLAIEPGHVVNFKRLAAGGTWKARVNWIAHAAV
ncbi:putative aldose 1-epimerase [Venturia nashicola]|uniref:Glucose-6-phosphate 1-epimerase n=1 Tax=Venturia nashicola TaxID=86259 RepID=A0A4Z1P269_9PEZI|nr:putative aldose 1-epimerase [Venturia nashicola]TLD20190.1 putative aldose 1-epimerase [Venturia nashicola]